MLTPFINQHKLNGSLLCMSDEQISPASLFCKRHSLHLHSLCMGNRDSKQIATAISTTVARS